MRCLIKSVAYVRYNGGGENAREHHGSVGPNVRRAAAFVHSATRLFVIYLAVVLLVFCFRAVRMLWYLRSLVRVANEATAFWLSMGLVLYKYGFT